MTFRIARFQPKLTGLLYSGGGMGQKSRQKRLARNSSQPETVGVVHPTANLSRSRSRKRRWSGPVVASGVPILLVVLVELALRLFGYGYSTKFFEPMPDGNTSALARRQGDGARRTVDPG